MKMTAEEALALYKGSTDHKGPIFKLRLWYLCGILNKRIENNAETGFVTATIKFSSQTTARQYCRVMKEFYEDLGYSVAYNDDDYCHRWLGEYGYIFVVSWNYKTLKEETKKAWRSFTYHSEA